jgi:hypothetical protein
MGLSNLPQLEPIVQALVEEWKREGWPPSVVLNILRGERADIAILKYAREEDDNA